MKVNLAHRPTRIGDHIKVEVTVLVDVLHFSSIVMLTCSQFKSHALTRRRAFLTIHSDLATGCGALGSRALRCDSTVVVIGLVHATFSGAAIHSTIIAIIAFFVVVLIFATISTMTNSRGTVVGILAGVFINSTITVVVKTITDFFLGASGFAFGERTTVHASNLASALTFAFTTYVSDWGTGVVISQNASAVLTDKLLAFNLGWRAVAIDSAFLAIRLLKAAGLVRCIPSPLALRNVLVGVERSASIGPGGLSGSTIGNYSMDSEIGGLAARISLDNCLI